MVTNTGLRDKVWSQRKATAESSEEREHVRVLVLFNISGLRNKQYEYNGKESKRKMHQGYSQKMTWLQWN